MRESLVEKRAEALIGTCKFDTLNGLEGDELEYFDQLAFNCAHCGWWYDTSDIDEVEGNSVCIECANMYHEEYDNED